jgi:hypothetical protein
MAVSNNQFLHTLAATEDLSDQSSRYKVVSLGGVIAPSTSRVAGVLVTSSRSGEQLSAVLYGITKAVAGGAVSTLGYPLTVATSGYLTVCASGGTAVGRALDICGSGDLVRVAVNFVSPFAWGGL